MFLHLDSKNRIVYYYTLPYDKQSDDAIKNGDVLYDGEFDFSMGENREGFVKEFYYEPDTKQIRIEYEPVAEPVPMVDSSEAKLDYLMMMQEGEEV